MDIELSKDAKAAVDRMQDYARQAGLDVGTSAPKPTPSPFCHWDDIAIPPCEPRCAECPHAASEASGAAEPYVLVTPAYLTELVETQARLTRELAEALQTNSQLRVALMRAETTGEKPHLIRMRMR